jgi:hypothetical protein
LLSVVLICFLLVWLVLGMMGRGHGGLGGRQGARAGGKGFGADVNGVGNACGGLKRAEFGPEDVGRGGLGAKSNARGGTLVQEWPPKARTSAQKKNAN